MKRLPGPRGSRTATNRISMTALYAVDTEDVRKATTASHPQTESF